MKNVFILHESMELRADGFGFGDFDGESKVHGEDRYFSVENWIEERFMQ